MRVTIFGGTGLLGYHAMFELLDRGHQVTVSARSTPPEGLLPPEVEFKPADVGLSSDEELRTLMSGQEAIVFAAGVDDRVTPRAPAYDFFYQHNVRTTERVFRMAREVGVKKAVLCSSYFRYFDRAWPELELSKHHPYIRARNEQAEAALTAGGGETTVSILELGYIFGSMPGRTPLWAILVNYARFPFPLFYMKGGTNMIAVEKVAEAIAGAVEKGETGAYTIGDENHSWTWLMEKLCELTGKKKTVRLIPPRMLELSARGLVFFHKLRGLESGLHPVEFIKVQTRNTFVDPAPSRKALGYGSGGLEEALRRTVEACPRR